MCPPISALYSKFSCGLDQSQAELAQALLPVQSVRAKSCLCGEQLGEFDRHLKFEFLTENQKSDLSFETNFKVTFGELKQIFLQ